MGFFRNQQIAAVKRLLKWHYENKGLETPGSNELVRQATAIVDQAGVIARRTGKNVFSIAKEMLGNLGDKTKE